MQLSSCTSGHGGSQLVVGLRGEALGVPCREKQPHSVSGHTVFDDWHLPCTTGLVLPLPLIVPGDGASLLLLGAPGYKSRGARPGLPLAAPARHLVAGVACADGVISPTDHALLRDAQTALPVPGAVPAPHRGPYSLG